MAAPMAGGRCQLWPGAAALVLVVCGTAATHGFVAVPQASSCKGTAVPLRMRTVPPPLRLAPAARGCRAPLLAARVPCPRAAPARAAALLASPAPGAGERGGAPGAFPNLSQIQELDELIGVIERAPAQLAGWEAALAMNHLARLQKRQRQQRGALADQTARAEANRLVAALAARVVDGADALRPKAFAWALNACVYLPPRTAGAPSARGQGGSEAKPRHLVLGPVVDALLEQVRRACMWSAAPVACARACLAGLPCSFG